MAPDYKANNKMIKNTKPRPKRKYKSKVAKLSNDVSKLKKAFHEEYKAIVNSGNATASAGGSLILLNGCALGTDIDDRIGRLFTNRSLASKFFIENDDTSAGAMARVLYFIDKSPDGTAPAVTDLLRSADIRAHRNLDNRKRFIILSDSVYLVDDASNHYKYDNYYRKLNLGTVCNAGTAGTIADINEGALYLLVLGETQNATNYPTIYYSTVVRYTDN